MVDREVCINGLIVVGLESFAVRYGTLVLYHMPSETGSVGML